MNGSCISCGFPQEEAAKHQADNPGKDYCLYCSREDGSMKSYDEVLTGYTQYLAESKSLDLKAARDAAITALATQPAWQQHTA